MVPDGHSAMNRATLGTATDLLAIKTNRFRFLGKAGGNLRYSGLRTGGEGFLTIAL
jgi:hypothetical protein